MATSKEYIEFVCEQIKDYNNVSYKKMFGEYMVYVNGKPVLLVCDNTVYIKIIPQAFPLEIAAKLEESGTGYPYKGSKIHYILDIEDTELVQPVIEVLEKITPLPKPKKRKKIVNYT